MKIALIKLGSRIALSSSGTSGGTGETLSIIKMLTTAGNQVDAYTKVLDKDLPPKDFNIFDLESNYTTINEKEYDCLVILNGNVNYFGGQDDPSQTLNYWIINNFKGKVFYILCDCNLLLKQIWPSVSKKDWSSRYNESDLLITRDDIVYISQPMYTEEVLVKARKANINIKECIHYPFEKFPLLTLDFSSFNENPEYDLSYGGTFRNGRREDDMIKFYFGYEPEFKVEMFGKIKIDNFNQDKIQGLSQPIFNKSVSYDEFSSKMNKSLATVIIGDPLYKKWGDLAQRIYESIKIGNVVFIDDSYDFDKRVFNNPILRDFNYVSSREDVMNKLKRVKDDIVLRRSILNLQAKDTQIDIKKYCEDFSNLLK